MILNLDDYQRLAQQLAAIATDPCLRASAAIEELLQEVERLQVELTELRDEFEFVDEVED